MTKCSTKKTGAQKLLRNLPMHMIKTSATMQINAETSSNMVTQ
jgi:hypothetical protein